MKWNKWNLRLFRGIIHVCCLITSRCFQSRVRSISFSTYVLPFFPSVFLPWCPIYYNHFPGGYCLKRKRRRDARLLPLLSEKHVPIMSLIFSPQSPTNRRKCLLMPGAKQEYDIRILPSRMITSLLLLMVLQSVVCSFFPGWNVSARSGLFARCLHQLATWESMK